MTTLREIQAHVGVTADGVIGPKTLDAIAAALKMPVARRASAAIIEYVKGVETLSKVRQDGKIGAYMPTPDDVPTIGYGSTGPDIVMGLVWTKAQCEARFASDFARFADTVDALIGKAPTTQGQFDALVSLAYNIGTGPDGLKGSTIRRMHNDGDYAGAAGQFGRWNKQASKVLKGLTIRRAVEREFYEGKRA